MGREHSLINRMRLAHTKLDSLLHLIGKHPSGKCDSCNQKEAGKCVLYLHKIQ